MTDDVQWTCVSKGSTWRFMKLSLLLSVVGLAIEGWLLLTHGPDTLGGYLRLLFLAFWSGLVGIVWFGLASAWFLWRTMAKCRKNDAHAGSVTRGSEWKSVVRTPDATGRRSSE